MASAIPALQGEFGSYEYWVTTMHVADLVEKVTIPRDLPGWESLSLDEKYQRDIDVNRVRKEIAPYFANEEHRFSNALVLAVMNSEEMEFESLSSVSSGTGKMSKLYRLAANNIGFLTFSGQETFVPLDGQHRSEAFKYALTGRDYQGKEIQGIKPNPNLGKDEVTVILLRYDLDAARAIFTNINKYAKPISKNGRLIVDDEDAVAVVSRSFIDGDTLIPARLVNIKSNTLTKKTGEFTTLPTIYEANKEIAKYYCSIQGGVEKANEEQREVMEEDVLRVWDLLLSGIDVFVEALFDKSVKGDDTRRDIREKYLLGKPIGQWALVKGFLEAIGRLRNVTDEEVCERLNDLDWRIEAQIWQGVLTEHGNTRRVLAGKSVANRSGRFIAYLVGAKFSPDEIRDLAEQVCGDPEAKLPDPKW